MAQRKSATKKAEVRDEPGVSGKKVYSQTEQNWYFWRNINRLWDAVKQLQQENDELRASKAGGP